MDSLKEKAMPARKDISCALTAYTHNVSGSDKVSQNFKVIMGH